MLAGFSARGPRGLARLRRRTARPPFNPETPPPAHVPRFDPPDFMEGGLLALLILNIALMLAGLWALGAFG